MGNEHSKGAACKLTDEQCRKLRKRITKEYPWLEGIEESMLITDMQQTDQPIVFANEDFYKMTQYSPKEVLGFNCRFLQGKHTNPKTVTNMREAIRNGKELEVEILNYRKDGTPFINTFLMVPLHSKKSDPSLVTFFIAVQKDVTYLVKETDPTDWRPAHVALWLEKAGYDEFVQPFIENEVCGKEFLEMNVQQLQKIGIQDVTIQNNLLHLVSMLETEGPDFIVDESRSPLHSKKSDDHETSSFHSNNSCDLSSYFLASGDGTHSEVDLHQPKFAAMWRRKESLASFEDLPRSYVEVKREISVPVRSSLTLLCSLESNGEKIEKNITVKQSAMLFQVKKKIKKQFGLDDSYNVSFYNNGAWKTPNSQHDYKALQKEATKTSQGYELLVRIDRLSEEENEHRRSLINLDIKGLSPTNSISRKRLSVPGREESDVVYSFLIHRENVTCRAMLYDTLVKSSRIEILLHSVENIWDSILVEKRPIGRCFVIPATSCGQIIDTKELANFSYATKCNELLTAKTDQFYGEIPIGTTVLVQIDSMFILLVVLVRSDLHEDVSSIDSYYISFRSILAAVDTHNSTIREGEAAKVHSLTEAAPNQLIEEVQFPVYQSVYESFVKSRQPHEALKFGRQVRIAFNSFLRWKKSKNSRNDTAPYQSYVKQFEKQLKKKFYKGYKKEKQTRFLEYLSSGDLSVRGLVDQEELEWLIEASGFNGDPSSRFTGSRRLQRLANLVLVAFINEKRFPTGKQFQNNIRASVVLNESCLQWILKMATAGSISLCPAVSLDDIEGVQRFASGGTSVVFRGKWKKNNEMVAVKQFHFGQSRESVLHEITLSSLLQHTNVLPVYGWGETEGPLGKQMFSVAPFVSGGSLYDILQADDPKFDFKARFSVFTQICVGLQYIHSLGMIHRDIKSLNILLTEENHVYIADVGAMRMFDTKMTSNTGTVFWMSPEMFESTSYTLSTDIYSLGMILFELIVNEIPFKELKNYEIPAVVMKGVRPRIPNNVAKPWSKLLVSMWQGKANKRPSVSNVIGSLMELKDVPFVK